MTVLQLKVMHVSSITQKLAICVIPADMSEENRAAAVTLLNTENISFFIHFLILLWYYYSFFLIVIYVAQPLDVSPTFLCLDFDAHRFFGCSLVSLLGLAYFKVAL